MSRSNKFILLLALHVLCILGFNFVSVGGDFFLNPFYILSFVTFFILIGKAIGYLCPLCGRNQVIRSLLSYRIPKEKCYFCRGPLDQKDN